MRRNVPAILVVSRDTRTRTVTTEEIEKRYGDDYLVVSRDAPETGSRPWSWRSGPPEGRRARRH
jgi:hypothetical protein